MRSHSITDSFCITDIIHRQYSHFISKVHSLVLACSRRLLGGFGWGHILLRDVMFFIPAKPHLFLSASHCLLHCTIISLSHTHFSERVHMWLSVPLFSSSCWRSGAEPSGHCSLMSHWLLCVCPVRTEKRPRCCRLSHAISVGRLAGAAASLKGFKAAEREIPVSSGGYPYLNRC